MMILFELIFVLAILVSFTINAVLTVFLLVRSHFSILFMVFSSFLLTFAGIIGRIGYGLEGNAQISLFALSTSLIGISIVILAFNFPEKTRLLRFWQRTTIISAGILISFGISGSIYPEIFSFLENEPSFSADFMILFLPAIFSFLSSLVVLENLYRLNQQLKDYFELPSFEWLFSLLGMIILLIISTISFPLLSQSEKTYLGIQIGVIAISLFSLVLVVYFIQRFPSLPAYQGFLEDGIVGWMLFRMADMGPEAMQVSDQFAERQDLSQEIIDQLAATVVSIAGFGHETTDFSLLHPSLFAIHLKNTFIGLAIPVLMEGEFKDPRFHGKTLAVLTLFIPSEIVQSINPGSLEGVDIDGNRLKEGDYHIINASMDVLKRIFD